MKNYLPKALLIAGATAFLLQGCNDSPPVKPAEGQESAEPRLLTLDEQFAEVSENLPEFAGFYLDEAGDYVVNLKNNGSLRPLSTTRVEEAVKKVFGDDVFEQSGADISAMNTQRPIKLRDVTYSFQDLSSWYNKAQELAAEYKLVFADVDEFENVISLGIEDEASIEKLRQQLVNVGIPNDALNLELAEPIQPVQRLLSDEYRPVLGGLYVARQGSWCTNGFNVRRGSTFGFLMNSHCTNRMGVVTGVTFWQNTEGDNSEYMGREIVDPVFNYDGKPSICRKLGKPCRYSDSIFASYANPATSGNGQLPYMSGPPNTRVFIGRYPVTNNVRNPYYNEEVWKIGARTGETRARVSKTCVNTGQKGTSLYFLCQMYGAPANGYIATDGGDSGSPVFAQKPGGAEPRGLLWGGSASYFVFSPISGLDRDLGHLDFTP